MLHLNKGQNLSLNKSNLPLQFNIGMGWDVNNTDTGKDFDLDASIILVDENNKVLSNTDWSSVVFYTNTKAPGLEHTGDNRTGSGDGDDETIKVDLNKVASNVNRLVITASIFAGRKRKQNFGQVQNAYVRLVDPITNTELLRYDLTEDFGSETALIFAEIYRHNGEWKMKATGAGYNGGFSALLNIYGLNVPEETDE